MLKQIARYGRGFSNGPVRGFGPFTVRSPFDLDPRSNAVQRKVTFDEDRAPLFDLEKMLKEQEIKRRIAEANKKALELAEREEKERMERERQEEEERRRKMEEEAKVSRANAEVL